MSRTRPAVALIAALLIVSLGLPAIRIQTAAADVNEAPTNPDQAKISAGYYHACVVTASGGVRCWGYNYYGALGDGTTTGRTAPVDVKNADGTLLSNVSTIATGQYHTCALLGDGTVSCWGKNGSGELGDGTRETRTNPVQVRNADGTLLSNVTAISLGQNTSCALTTATTVKCWGSNTFGELGIGITPLSPSPVDVHTASDDSSPLTGITAISAGQTFVCAITTTQSVKCWGRNLRGNLGDGTTVDKSTPVEVHTSAADSDPLTGITAISAGSQHTCALTTTNTVKCWGANSFNQLGDNTITQRTTPVDALNADGSNLSDVTAISAAGHSCGLTSTNSVKCWGYNNYGQVGDGTNTISLPVTDVLATGESPGGQALASISAVTTGANFTCALTSSNSVKCWGHNGNGQLGDGTQTGRNTPVNVQPPIDTTPPTATITRTGSGTLGYGDTDTITITLSETASDFDVGDITITNATLSAFSGSGTTYNATLTPNPDTTGTITLDIATGTFTDTAGNTNTAATQLTVTIDTTPPPGITWTTRTSPANSWRSVTYGNGLFVAVATSGTGNRVMTSPDGINWTLRSSAADNNWRSITYGNGLFVAVAYTGTGNRVMTSPDGITWTSRQEAADNQWVSVTYGNGLFVAVAATGTGNRVMTSPDGITWTIRSSAADNQWASVTYANGLFVAVAATGTGNRVMTSPDGITWTTQTSPADNNWLSVTYGNGLFVAVSNTGTGNRVMTSPDGGCSDCVPCWQQWVWRGRLPDRRRRR